MVQVRSQPIGPMPTRSGPGFKYRSLSPPSARSEILMDAYCDFKCLLHTPADLNGTENRKLQDSGHASALEAGSVTADSVFGVPARAYFVLKHAYRNPPERLPRA